MNRPAVRHTAELDRVLGLPRRSWDPKDAIELAGELTALLKTPHGTMKLRPVQAVALAEAYELGGLFGPIGVGEGKTLISLLLAHVLESDRPLLVLPAKLIGKTRHEWRDLAHHWQIPNWIRLMSYEMCGRVQAKDALEQFEPDAILFDEVHKVKNRKAAVTRRFERYIKARREADYAAPGVASARSPRPRLPLRACGFSGTITSKSLRDFAHVMQWCIPANSVLPWTWVELDDWANALDELNNPLNRLHPGALLELCGPDEQDAPDAMTAARRGFRRRMVETPGVVATRESTLGASLLISAFGVNESTGEMSIPSPAIDKALDDVRPHYREGSPSMVLPDGWELIDGPSVWRHARELVLGFYYVWDPRPPVEWMQARSCWATFARGVIQNARSAHPCDSAEDVALNYRRFPCTVDFMRHQKGLPPLQTADGAKHVYEYWKEIEPTFKPNQKAVWICDSVLKLCEGWIQEHPRGIVWTEHVAFAEELSKRTGVAYYGAEGCDERGRYIEHADGPVIASVMANFEGRNLQYKWHENLITAWPPSALVCEQLLARTHRSGQAEDTVTAEVFFGCVEHVGAIETALQRAHYIQDTTGNPQKLVYADKALPGLDEVVDWKGPRWQK